MDNEELMDRIKELERKLEKLEDSDTERRLTIIEKELRYRGFIG